MRQACRLVCPPWARLGLLGILLCHCAPAVRLSAEARQGLAAQYAGRAVELRQSAYFGRLYDDTDRWLLSPARPESTSHVSLPRGAPVHPPAARGIAPAGSRFRIAYLEFPGPWALLRRTLISPRFSPWVVLCPEGPPPLGSEGAPRRPFVWVLPMDLDDPAQVQQAMQAAFAPPGVASAWLSTRRPTVAVAIAHKRLLLGMRREEMVAAMGAPQRQLIDSLDARRVEVAWYAEQEAWLQGDAIVALQPPRPLLAERDGGAGPQKPASGRHTK